ncbi:thermonuclease family protein [archaeon]|nr:thermonuclease family protein [archaeon]
MLKQMILIFLLIFVSGCTGNIVFESEELILEGPFVVTYVVDGDTLDLDNGDRIRFSGINTPETGECYYQEAKDRLKELTLDKEVYLEQDTSDTGKYGRKLRYIYLNEDEMVNEILVMEGFAKVYDKYSYDTKRYMQLKRAEADAIIDSLGVWSCEDLKEGCLYVGSKNSDKYYPPDCKYAKKIKAENLVCYMSEEEVVGLVAGSC